MKKRVLEARDSIILRCRALAELDDLAVTGNERLGEAGDLYRLFVQ